MPISVFDIFKIGIGPSSSHTVGPMKAARQFVLDIDRAGQLPAVREVSVQLYGSLALTGRGHGTDRAILLGLLGETPEDVDPDRIEIVLGQIRNENRVSLLGKHPISFDEPLNLLFHRDQVLAAHPNGMRFTALGDGGHTILKEEFYSIGGGFVVRAEDLDNPQHAQRSVDLPYRFDSGDELLRKSETAGLQIHELVLENEKSWRSESDVREGVLRIWQVMKACVERGLHQEGVLPGVLKLPRRAAKLYRRLTESRSPDFPAEAMDWVNAFALAVNEENAAGGRVVTAPTNGAAGIVPAVLQYYEHFVDGADEDGVIRFLLTAGAIAVLYKKNASISGAEMGCQGEVGVACSMAAGGLVAALRGNNHAVENAAEIGMEHNLGLTCDPVAGLVQIPCIERNAMGSIKAINAARLAMHGDGTHTVSLDQVIATMRQTGHDMQSIYKETSKGGLAVNVPEC